jgi:excisionase family DNA binding protein
MSPTQSTKLITIKAAADQLTFKPHTLYTMVAKGIFPAVRIGKSIRISVTDMEAFIAANRTFSRKEALA